MSNKTSKYPLKDEICNYNCKRSPQNKKKWEISKYARICTKKVSFFKPLPMP